MKRFFVLLSILLFSVTEIGFSHDGTLDAYGNGVTTTTPGQRIRRGRGHDRDKERIQSGDIIQGIYGRGYTGSAFTTSDNVSIEMQAGENFSSTANGTKIVFKTTPLTTATAAASLTVSSTGLSLLTDAAPRTNLTPLAAGTLVWNSQDGQLCISTGTAVNSWVQVADGTTACSH